MTRPHETAREQQVACAGGADLAGQDVAVVGVGDAPEQLGCAKRRPLAGDRHVAQHGDHQPAALADAVDGAHDRLARLAHGVEGHQVHPEHSGQAVAPRVGTGAAHVATRDEDVVGAGNEQAGQVRVGVDVVGGVAHAEVHGRGHGVAGLGPVDDAAGQRPVALETQVRSPEPVALGGTTVGHAAPITSAPNPAMVSTGAKSVNHV